MYSLNRSIGRVRGITFLVDRIGQSRHVSAAAVLLHATVARRASGRVSISGSVVAPGHIRRAIHGSGHVFGSLTRRGNWIVPPEGRVSGVTTKASTMEAGGGNCSVWASLKSLSYGVYCGFFM